MKMLLRVGLFCVAALVFGTALHSLHHRLSAAPLKAPPRSTSGLAIGPAAIEQSFAAASSNSPEAVGRLVDAALACTVFADSADSLREHVFRSEMAYRAGRLYPIPIRRLARANNFMASVAFAPTSLRTTEDQIRLFRTVWHSGMPHFIGTSDALSPVEAVFLIGSLTQQKLINSDFHLDQPTVEKLIAARNQPHEAHYTLKAVMMPRPLQDVQSALHEQLPREWSLGTIAVHAFFRLAGIRNS